MLLQDVLKTKGTKVWSIQANQSLREALKVLIEQKIGTLLVFDEKEKIVGIISERDIIRECHRTGKDWEAVPVNKTMTKDLVIGAPSDTVQYIMGIMTQNRVRHIPVIEKGKLVGLISIGDVVKAQLKDSEYENKYLKEYMYGG